MENASKALLMAGGILIALLVLGALLLMFNQLSDYQRSNTELLNRSQISEFNSKFTQYARNDLQGYDLISLINKVVDYNRRTGIYGELDYNIKINLTINITSAFQTKFGGTLNKLKVGTYTVKTRSDSLYQMLDEFRQYDYTYTLDVMTTLVSNRQSLLDGTKSSSEFTNDKQPFKDLSGNVVEGEELVRILDDYSEYSAFKSSTFRILDEPTYTGNQVSGMSFQYLK